jgi:hypothetical protein
VVAIDGVPKHERSPSNASLGPASPMGLLACVAIASTPALATLCSNLQSLHLQDTTITSATDNTTGVFVAPGSSPITGLPAFCRVTATLIPTSDSNMKIEIWLPETTWNGRFLGTGGGGFQGVGLDLGTRTLGTGTLVTRMGGTPL